MGQRLPARQPSAIPTPAAHDVLETINHQLVTEVAKTTAATLMLLASSPSRVKDLKVDSFRNGAATLLDGKPRNECDRLCRGLRACGAARGSADSRHQTNRHVTDVQPGTTVAVWR